VAWDASPWETKANEAVVRANSEQLFGLAGRITGRGTDLKGTIDKGAMEFSSLVADPIESVNGDNAKVWQEGTQASFFGGTVLGQWAGEVETFTTALEALEERYRTGLNKIFEIGTGGPGEGAASTGRLQAQDNLEAELTREATRLREAFDSDTEKRGGQMANGPTPEVLKELVTDGDMGWAGWNLWGAKAPVPLDAKDGEKLAEMLAAKLRDGDKLTDADRELLIQLQALAGHALWMQKNGGDLTKNELGFLKALYNGLDTDKRGYEKPFHGDSLLLQIPGWLKDGGYSEGDIELVQEALGGGLLAVSDEGIGGGFGMLPSDVQNILNAEVDPDFHDIPAGEGAEGFWRNQFVPLAALLGAAPATIKGGMEMSAKLTLRSAEYSSMLDETEDIEPLQDLLDVSTRNHEANRAILEGGYRNEKYGADTPEFVLRQLFGKQDWTDKGEAASSLIDWIPESAKSEDAYERELAGYSAAALIDITTNTTESSHFKDTAFEFFTNAGGEIGDDKAAPMGQRNPFVAQAMGEVAGTYLDSWGKFDPGKGLTTEWSLGHLSVDHNDRSRFFQLIAADPTARGRLGDDILAQLAMNAGDMVRAGEGSAADGIRGDLRDANGLLLGYFNRAVEDNMFDQVSGVEKGQQDAYAKAMADHARNDAIAGGFLGLGGTAVNSGVGAYNDANPAVAPAGGGPAMRTPWGYAWRAFPSLAQTALGFPISELNGPPDAYNEDDVAYQNVESVQYKQMSMLTNQAMVNAAVESGQIDVADLPEGLRGDGGVRAFDRDDMLHASNINGQLEGVLKKAGYGWAEGAHRGTYETYDDLFDDRESYKDYLQHRNDPEDK